MIGADTADHIDSSLHCGDTDLLPWYVQRRNRCPLSNLQCNQEGEADHPLIFARTMKALRDYCFPSSVHRSRIPIMAMRAVLLVCLILLVLSAFRAFSDGPGHVETQPEFYFTRLMYTDTRGRGPRPGQAAPSTDFEHGHGLGDQLSWFLGAWMTDTWDADYQFMWGVQRLTNARMHMKPHPMRIMDPDLFKYPYVYAVEVGQMELKQEEAERLREYLLRGGFWHCDDFWGLRQWGQFARQVKKIFPEREIVEIPLTHEIFHTFYDIDQVLQPPNDGLGRYYTYSGGRTRTWEQPDDRDPHVRGVFDDKGRLMILITYNADLGDAWEWMDDPDYPAKFTGYAYRLGMNAIIYAMTH